MTKKTHIFETSELYFKAADRPRLHEGKQTVMPVHAIKVRRGKMSIAPLILSLRTRCMCGQFHALAALLRGKKTGTN